MRRHPAIPWVLPFAIFIALLALQSTIAVPVWARLVLPLIAIAVYSRDALRGGPSKPLQSILLGVAVFVVWIGPDLISSSWHHFILFDNAVMGHPAGNTPPAAKNDPVFLAIRIAVSVIAVPLLEELFWRGWMMRWLISSNDFESVALGTFAPLAFWATALLFASRGWNVIATMRNPDKEAELAAVKGITLLPLDVTDPAQIKAAAAAALARGPPAACGLHDAGLLRLFAALNRTVSPLFSGNDII